MNIRLKIKRALLISAALVLLCACSHKEYSNEPLAPVNVSPTDKKPDLVHTEAPGTPLPSPTPDPYIHLSCGDFLPDSSELDLPFVSEADCVLLSGFDALVSLSVNGAENYDALISFAEAHPGIKVSYAVSVSGTSYRNDAERIETAGARIDTDELCAAIKYLPNLTEIDLGGAEITPDEWLKVAEPFSGSLENYVLSALGKKISSAEEVLDLNGIGASKLDSVVKAVSCLPNVRKVDLSSGNGWTLEQIGKLQADIPSLAVDYPVSEFGLSFSLADQYLTLSGIGFNSGKIEKLKKLVPYMTNCQKVIMENCGLNNEQMDALRSELSPYTEVVWRINCGRYTCRTDALMIKFSAGTPNCLTDSKADVLKYCHDIEYLDLGHNHLRHIDFVANMPNLKVCIIAVNYLIDIGPIANCPKLEYCEFLSGLITDASPLASCTELEHLNIAYNQIKDISPLFGLKKLKRLWISRNKYPEEQEQLLRDALPDTLINTTAHNPTSQGWRVDERYDLLREQFMYDNTKARSYYEMYGEIVIDPKR